MNMITGWFLSFLSLMRVLGTCFDKFFFLCQPLMLFENKVMISG